MKSARLRKWWSNMEIMCTFIESSNQRIYLANKNGKFTCCFCSVNFEIPTSGYTFQPFNLLIDYTSTSRLKSMNKTSFATSFNKFLFSRLACIRCIVQGSSSGGQGAGGSCPTPCPQPFASQFSSYMNSLECPWCLPYMCSRCLPILRNVSAARVSHIWVPVCGCSVFSLFRLALVLDYHEVKVSFVLV